MLKKNALSNAVIYTLIAGGSQIPANANAEEANKDKKKDKKEGKRVIETVLVTATKTKQQDMQNTPLSIQALDGMALKEMNIGNMSDLNQQMPSISLGGRGPGQNDVFIRGMSIQPITVMLSGAQGTMPNVALYLDEQPVTAPGRNLDVYATDLERIEVLPGPQGTLFGASSQAGTIRYITNKPDTEGFSAGFDTSIATTKSGDMSNSVEAYINVPLSDKMAIRGAFYNVQRGGYIDNVANEFTLDPAINPDSSVDLGPDASYETASNVELAEENFNDSYYKGARLGFKYDFDNDWSLLIQHTQQELGADGVFDYDPEVGDLEVSRFFQDRLEDAFGQTAWTLEGRLGMLDMVYTGAYLDREIEQSVDYTGYNNAGAWIAYYTCTYNNPNYVVNYNISPEYITENRQCLDPTKGFKGQQEQSRFTQEIRFSTPEENRWRAVAGLFYDNYEIETQDDYYYVATPALGFAPNAPISTANNINPNTRPAGVAFFNDITRTEEQIAFFGEFSYDISDRLTATLGLRYYNLESDFTGSSNFANGIFSGSLDYDSGRDYDVSGGHTDEPMEQDGFIPKLNLSYFLADNILLYGTYSEGFRPGGFNRGGGLPSANPAFPTVKTTYETDDVTNYEFGWKAMLLDNSLRFNGSIYFVEWTDMQVSRFDPQNVSILTFIENSADSEIFGLESNLTWRATDQLTLYGALSYNDTELTSVDAQVIEMAPIGSELPLTPKLQGNVRARYEWSLSGELADYAYVQGGIQFADEAWSSIVAANRHKQDAYSIGQLSVGIANNQWRAELFVDNISDERAQLFINDQDDIVRISTNRPRTIGLNISYDY